MFRHIVLYTIKDEFRDQIPLLVKAFYDMAPEIPGLLQLESGGDILRSQRSCDMSLNMLFTDRAAYEAYLVHPAHLPVKERMHRMRSGSYSCDYEIEGDREA